MLGSLETGMGEKEDGHGFEGKLGHDQLLTDPDQAVEFVKATQVDALAIAMGTSHGAYKFTRKPDGDVLAMNVIEEIHRRLPNTHLVMHGSSSVPQDLQDIINQYGGEMPQTWGVPVEEIQRGIKHGVRKINIDTDNRMAMTGAIRKVFAENPGEFDPRKYLKPAMDAMRAVCRQRFEEFGTAGWASKITPLPMTAMAKRYAAGRTRRRRSASPATPRSSPPQGRPRQEPRAAERLGRICARELPSSMARPSPASRASRCSAGWAFFAASKIGDGWRGLGADLALCGRRRRSSPAALAGFLMWLAFYSANHGYDDRIDDDDQP